MTVLPPDRRPRPLAIAAICAIVALILSTVLADVALHLVQQQRIDNLTSQLSAGQTTYSSLLDKYTALTQDCAKAPNCTSSVPAPSEVPQSLPGPRGDTGATGATGPGASDAQVYAQVQSFCTTTSFCVGAQGQPGTPGATGPAGPSGPAGPAGSDGAPGTQGPQGNPGPAGADGQPPVSWTYADPLGKQHTCTRADPFDPSAPTYTCS